VVYQEGIGIAVPWTMDLCVALLKVLWEGIGSAVVHDMFTFLYCSRSYSQ
jgi:hypothetical protein